MIRDASDGENRAVNKLDQGNGEMVVSWPVEAGSEVANTWVANIISIGSV
jgi:hypothetical protein